MQAWHITIATVDRLPMFRDERGLRRLVLRLADVEHRHCGLFGLVHEHLHDLEIGERDVVGRFVGSMVQAIQRATGVRLGPADIRPVEHRGHARRLVPYLLTQVSHHDLGHDPALWMGSSFADLVGARDVPQLRPAIGDLLPQLRRSDIYEAVGLPARGVAPASDEQLRAAGALRIARAAAAAACADPQLRGRAVPERDARRAAAHLAKSVGISTAEAAWALGITPRAARRVMCGPVRSTLLDATRLRLAFEDAVATRGRRVA